MCRTNCVGRGCANTSNTWPRSRARCAADMGLCRHLLQRQVAVCARLSGSSRNRRSRDSRSAATPPQLSCSFSLTAFCLNLYFTWAKPHILPIIDIQRNHRLCPYEMAVSRKSCCPPATPKNANSPSGANESNSIGVGADFNLGSAAVEVHGPRKGRVSGTGRTRPERRRLRVRKGELIDAGIDSTLLHQPAGPLK